MADKVQQTRGISFDSPHSCKMPGMGVHAHNFSAEETRQLAPCSSLASQPNTVHTYIHTYIYTSHNINITPIYNEKTNFETIGKDGRRCFLGYKDSIFLFGVVITRLLTLNH